MTTTTYQTDANNFATKHNVKLSFIGEPEFKRHFADDTEARYVFKCKLTRNGKSYTFNFGQSINSGAEEPTLYDILACIQKYDVGSFEDFYGEFGYNEDSRKAEKTYKAVCKEFKAVERLFGDVMEELYEIQ